MFGRFFRHRAGGRRHHRRRVPGDENLIELADLPAGKEAKVVRFEGGPILARRLSVLGLRPGNKVTRVSTMLMRGPVHVKVGQVEIALGQGMARRVLVSPLDS